MFPEEQVKSMLLDLAKYFMPYYIVATFAYLGMQITFVFLIIHLIFGLPFSPMWGFMAVPLGTVVAFIAKKTGFKELNIENMNKRK